MKYGSTSGRTEVVVTYRSGAVGAGNAYDADSDTCTAETPAHRADATYTKGPCNGTFLVVVVKIACRYSDEIRDKEIDRERD